MTTPTHVEVKHTPALSILVYITVTLLAVRWSGYALLPYVVIFAPLLTAVGILVLAVVLMVIAAALSGSGGGRK